jgi:predicted permease
LNDRVCTVIGVAPRGFYGGFNAVSFDVWLPAAFAREFQSSSTELTDRKARYSSMLARMRPDANAARVQGELDAAARFLLDTYPETNRGLGYTLLPLWRSPRGGQAMVLALATLQFFAALILAVVCANTASLLLAHASTRRREIGVRLALGAAPSRIVFQLLGESLALATCAILGGYIVALWSGDLLRNMQFSLPGSLHLRVATELDWTALLFGSGLALGCGVIFGLAPALQLARADVIDSLRTGSGALPGRSRLRDILVAAEVALALVLLVLASLFSVSFRHALAANPGFDVDRVLLSSLDFTSKGYSADRTRAFTEDLLRRLRETPGITGASVSNSVLLDLHGLPTGVIWVHGTTFDPNAKIRYAFASPGHLQTLGMPLRAGSDLSPLNRTDLPVDAVINERMAQLYWPGVSPIGRKFVVNDTDYIVAGVVRDARYESLNEAPLPLAWLTLRSRPLGLPVLHVRADGDPRLALGSVRRVVHELDPALPLLEVRTLSQHVENNLITQRIPARMLAFLGPLALILAASGLYAVIAYALAQRTREIGVRLALGASPRRVVSLMIWQGLRTVLVGSAIGAVVALALGYVLRDRLVGVHFGDPTIYLGVPLLLLAVATLACWLPARRAARVDPLVALRAE